LLIVASLSSIVFVQGVFAAIFIAGPQAAASMTLVPHVFPALHDFLRRSSLVRVDRAETAEQTVPLSADACHLHI
jgi:hypothetical protein